MTVTITNATSNPILTTSGKSINAYGGVTVDDTASLTTAETVTITLSQSESNNPGNNFSFYPTATSLGTITDPNGGGSFNLSTETFTETGLVGGDPNFATALLSRLVYNAPTLPAGQGLGSQAQITVTDNSSGTPEDSTTFSDPVIVGVLSPPLISGTAADEPVASGNPIPPFATLTLANTNFSYNYYIYTTTPGSLYSTYNPVSSYSYDPKDTAAIIVTYGGNTTDSYGLLTGPGLSKTGVGTYTLTTDYYYSLQSEIRALSFQTVALPAGQMATVSFELDITDPTGGLTSKNTMTSVLIIGPPLVPVAPNISGTFAGQTVTEGNLIKPFASVTVSDANSNPMDSVTITETDSSGTASDANGKLTAAGLTEVSSGVYTFLSAGPVIISKEIDGLTFTPTAQATTEFTIDVTDPNVDTSASDSVTTVIAVASSSSSSFFSSFSNQSGAPVWLQNSSGPLELWEMSSTTIVGGGQVTPNPGPAWSAMGTGDFYSNGNTDILWQNTDGSVALWEMNDTNIIGGGLTTSDPGSTWHIEGTGNFYGDGNDSILFQNDNGSVALWKMSGTTVIGGGLAPSSPGPSWHVEGTGNFFAGNTGIVFQNDDGSVALWDMNGTNIVGGGLVASEPGPTWHIKGTGDFYGDGHTDILWQNDNGSVALWEMNGTGIIAGGLIADPGPTWHIQATGDYNSDGHTDIAFQNDDGTVATWEMSGTNIIGGGIVSNPGSGWNVFDENMRFIYSASANETLAATAAPDEFVFTSFADGMHTIAGFNPVQDMIEFSKAQFASFTDVQAATSAIPGGAMINLGNGSSLLLPGTNLASLHASNFALA
jgi:hypothetical protein